MKNRQIRVMHILLSLECGGAEKVAVNLIKKLGGNGFNFSVCTLDKLGELKDELGDAVNIQCANRKSGIDFTLPARLSKIIRKFSPDVIHMHNPTSLLYGVIAGKLAGAPRMIVTQHGKILKESSRMRIINKRISYFLDKTVSVSIDVADNIKNSYKVKKSKTETIINGIDEALYKKDEAKRALGRLQFNLDGEIVIGHIARLSPEKDQKTLLCAFSKIAREINKVRLMIVGGGPLCDSLEALAIELDIKDKVIFTGFQKDIPYFLNIFDMFVLSSIREGTSLTLIEAMAASLPVIATDVGGNSKVIVDKKTGILVPAQSPDKLAEAMVYLAKNPALREKMGKEGRKRVEEKFSLSKMADEYAKLYRELARK